MNVDDPRLTAYTLGELSPEERVEVEKLLSISPDAQRFVQETGNVARILKTEYATAAATEHEEKPANLIDIRDDPWFWSIARPLAIAAVVALLATVGAVVIGRYQRSNAPPNPTLALNRDLVEVPKIGRASCRERV